jgi:hypothetical protein
MLKIVLLISALILQSCGTVSSIRPTVQNKPIDINSYKALVINDFANATPRKINEIAKETFPNKLQKNLEESHLFESVQRNEALNDSLIISGKIVEYEEGNSILRALVGFGAGRSYFSSDIDLIDGNSNEKIGTIEVRRKSWLLGGQIASNQTVQVLMETSVADIVDRIKDSVMKK